MRRRASTATAAPVRLSFADYLAECPAPVDGWAAEPRAVEVRAVLYVRRHDFAHGRAPYETAAALARDFLTGAAP